MIKDSVYDLINAIILQAVKDYRKALRGEIVDNRFPRDAIREIETFFRSEYYELLTKANGEIIIEKIRQEAKECERLN